MAQEDDLTLPIVLVMMVVLSLCITACGRSVLAPIVKDQQVSGISAATATGSSSHIVSRGETLISIAFRYGLNFREIAKWNNIPSPFVIYPNQRLTLRPSNGANTKPVLTTNSISQSGSNKQKTSSNAGSASATVVQQKSKSPSTNQSVTAWVWPVEGKVITSYKRSGEKGIDISGQFGQAIRAAAKGKVVYSGGGLIGYGELIIIKHNKNYLSAYGHNNKLLVKQGDFVDSGQRIATMGHSGTDEVKLHFEIRRDGKPVDPIRYLPK